MFTIIREGTSQIIEKKSKFIAKAIPVQSEEEAILRISEIKKIHYNAAHNVFAYRIGEQNEITRFSDDGEPSGTAGLPVLDVLNGEDLHYTLIVVTRYFGGILLGTGGLVRCYGKAASQAVSETGIVERISCYIMYVETAYNFLGKIQYLAAQSEYIIHDMQYTDTVQITFHIEENRMEIFIKNISELTNGIVIPSVGERVYLTRPYKF